MHMREIINLVEGPVANPQKWWLNVNTGEVIDVHADHFDAFDPKRFGVSAEEILEIRDKWEDDPDSDEIIFWEIAYHANRLSR